MFRGQRVATDTMMKVMMDLSKVSTGQVLEVATNIAPIVIVSLVNSGLMATKQVLQTMIAHAKFHSWVA